MTYTKKFHCLVPLQIHVFATYFPGSLILPTLGTRLMYWPGCLVYVIWCLSCNLAKKNTSDFIKRREARSFRRGLRIYFSERRATKHLCSVTCELLSKITAPNWSQRFAEFIRCQQNADSVSGPGTFFFFVFFSSHTFLAPQWLQLDFNWPPSLCWNTLVMMWGFLHQDCIFCTEIMFNFDWVQGNLFKFT